MGYKNDQYKRVVDLIENSDVFYGDIGNGFFRKEHHPFVLNARTKNLYTPIRYKAIEYFADNNISWWGGYWPTNHTLSSQIACINHLFPFRHDREAVLSLAKKVNSDIVDVLIIESDRHHAGYIQFEAVSQSDHLNEMDGLSPSRGSHCTSVDALILGKLANGRNQLLVIEWKYTESYGNENKGNGVKGATRKQRYTNLINESTELLTDFCDIYYHEPFYQLMRQTLWAEQMIKHKNDELIKADDFLHIHVIPPENYDLLRKIYRCSNEEMEKTWRSCLANTAKYIIISPSDLLSPIDNELYGELLSYLRTRYWK